MGEYPGRLRCHWLRRDRAVSVSDLSTAVELLGRAYAKLYVS